MPANATDRLYAATAKALQRPEVSKRLSAMGAEVVGGTPARMGAHLKSEMERWVRLAREVKFELAD
jgi:tripartite-type tricarboxylate transporter receptor subunit TctC